METRKQEFVGTIRKCPNCGTQLPGLTAVCPQCGYEITGVGAVSSVREFFNTYQNEKSEKRQLELIKNYPVPNTKEDIIEFALLAAQQVKAFLSSEHLKHTMSSYESTANSDFVAKGIAGQFKDALLGDKTIKEKTEKVPKADFLAAWKGKLEQINMKADIVFANDHKTLEQIHKIVFDVMETEGKLEQLGKKREAAENRSFTFALLPVILMFLLGGGTLFWFSKGPTKEEKETQRLETLQQAIIQDIENKDYASAEVKLSDLRWTIITFPKSPNAKSWDEKRETLQKQLESKKKEKK